MAGPEMMSDRMAVTREAEASLGVARRPGRAAPTDAERLAANELEQAATARLWLGAIVLSALLIRLLLFVLGPYGDASLAVVPDSSTYADLAYNLGEHQAFARTGGDGVLLLEGATRPGYPLLLAGVHALGLPLQAVVLVQIGLSAATAILVYLLGVALLGRRLPALVAAGVVALHPADWLASLTLTPASLFVPLLLMGLIAAASRDRRDFVTSSLGGLSLGLASLVQPVTVLLAPALGVWMVLSDRRLRTVGAAAVLAVAAAAPSAGWAYRNQSLGLEPFAGTPDAALAAADPTELPGRLVLLLTGHDTAGLARTLGLDAPDYLPAHPFTQPSDWRHTVGQPLTASLGVASVWAAINTLLLLTAMVGAILHLLRAQWTRLALLVGLLLVTTAAWPGVMAETYRLPVLGLQALLAASVFLPAPVREGPSLWARFLERRRLTADETEDADPQPALTGRPI